MSDAGQSGADERDPRVLSPAKAPTRGPETPAATGTSEEAQSPRGAQSSYSGSSQRGNPAPFKPVSPGRAMTPPARSSSPKDRPSVFERSMGAMRVVLPMMQKMLPLLEGNVASAVSNLLAPYPQGHAVDLAPLENAVGEMHKEHLDLRNRVAEQNTMLRRVADQIDMVKETTDRHSLGQQELLQDLHNLRQRVSMFGWIGLALLIVSIFLNVMLFLRVERPLP